MEFRKKKKIRRRVYTSQGPHHCWHIDGNHKLRHGRIVIHGAIDGDTRTILYLKATNNNKSRTAFDAFMSGVRVYGVPSHARIDQGGENVVIADFLLTVRDVWSLYLPTWSFSVCHGITIHCPQ